MQKHSISLSGHRTSITLEAPFWQEIKEIAKRQGISLAQLIKDIDNRRFDNRPAPNLSSAIRLYVLNDLKSRLGSIGHKNLGVE